MNDMTSDNDKLQDHIPFSPPPPRPWWPWAVPLMVSAAAAAYWWWSTHKPKVVVEVSAPARDQSKAPLAVPAPLPQPRETASRSDGLLRKCVVEDKVTYTDGVCPSGSVESKPELTPSLQNPETAGRRHITLYRCHSKANQYFWSRKTCSEWGARVERMTGVPEGWSFERQVALAEQRRRDSLSSSEPPTKATQSVTPVPSAASLKANECQDLDREIANIDSMARQVLDYTQQDRLRVARKQARDRQFALGCGRS